MASMADLCQHIADITDPSIAREKFELVDAERLESSARQLRELIERLEVARKNGDATVVRKKAPRVKGIQKVTPWLPLLLGSIVLFIVTAYAWWPAFFHDFHGGFFMDDQMIKKNNNVYETIDWRRIFRTDYWGLEMFKEGGWTHKSFRPLAVLTFRLNYWLHTFESTGFHVMNVLLHVVTSVLLGVVAYASLGLPVDWALLMAALFFAHPVHTENVLYIVGRADLLCLALLLIALQLYFPCIDDSSKRSTGALAAVRLLLATILLVAAGLCKETGFCFFGLLCGWELLRLLTARRGDNLQAPRSLRLVALLVLGSAACYWRVWYTSGTSIERMDPQSNPVAVHPEKNVRVLSYALVHGVYGKLLVWPSFLCYDYSFDAIPLVHSLTDLRLLLPATVYLSILMMLVVSLEVLRPRTAVKLRQFASREACEAPIIGVASIVLSFAPMSNILFPVGTMIGERLLYIPSAGLLITAVSLGFLAGPKWSRMWAALLLAAGAAGAWRTAIRVPEWETADTITVADGIAQPRSSRVQFNYANIHLQQKRYDEALLTYQRAIDLDPTDHDALPLYHAGQILFFQGRKVEAASYLEKAVSGFYSPLTIKEEEIFHDYALALWFVERFQESIINFQKTMMINPTFTKGLNNMACAMSIGSLTGKLPREYYNEGINALDQAVRLEPGNVLYWRNAIAVFSAGGDQQRAMATLQQLVAMDPSGNHDGNPPSECTWEFYFR
eukprot:TRINITY_DN80443_c0_g1_i1.p1 TRINITY_DN80443_c0_g1~~TRINITY_DN80443_c0_g1_i1.p1  ORF type:complete len:729 (+),score=120.29 TRINITY_DN80443_c0_g1_i1:172-2358(+)